MVKNILLIVLGSVMLTFVGIKREAIFSSPSLFIKHKPTLKFIYTLPIGDSGKKLKDFPPDLQREVLLYKEFVWDQDRLLFNYVPVTYVPAYFLAQTAVFLIVLGGVRIYLQNSVFKLANILVESILGYAYFIFIYSLIYWLDWKLDIHIIILFILLVLGNGVIIFFCENKTKYSIK